jgi:hypothetical protein
MPKKLERPSPEEEAEINRGIALDPDTWVLSDEEWAKVRPAREVDPALFGPGRLSDSVGRKSRNAATLKKSSAGGRRG